MLIKMICPVVDNSPTPYEVVEIDVWNEDGNNIENILQKMSPLAFHINKRNKRDTYSKIKFQNLKINLKTQSSNIELVLNPIHRTIVSTTTKEWISKNSSTVKPLQTGCLFEGNSSNDTDSIGVFSMCGAIVSLSFCVWSEDFFIKQLSQVRTSAV